MHLCWPIADVAHCHAPPAVVVKKHWATGEACSPSRRPHIRARAGKEKVIQSILLRRNGRIDCIGEFAT